MRTQPLNDFEDEVFATNAAMDYLANKDDSNTTIIDFIKNRKKTYSMAEDGSAQKQQILEELHVSVWMFLRLCNTRIFWNCRQCPTILLHGVKFYFFQRVERELHGKTQAHNHIIQYGISQEQSAGSVLPHMLNIDIAMQQQKQGKNDIWFVNLIFYSQIYETNAASLCRIW